MTNSKVTKRALLLSSMSLLLCVAMLLGTTFAWFTDSVTSANNIITAGNLDVELYHSNRVDKDQPVNENTKLFDEVNLWEPGAMVWEKLTVKNAGTLALKYILSINVTDISTLSDGKSLADVLKVAVLDEQPSRENVPAAATQNLETFNLASSQALDPNASDEFYVAIYWAPSANDNDYNVANEALKATLGVNLVATQLTAESDGFDNQYDKDAFVADAYVTTADGLIEALEGAGEGEIIGLMNNIKIDPANMSNAYGTTGINIKNGQTLDGNGNTLDIKGAGGTWDSGINTTGGTIRNLTITGSFRGIFINHNSTHSEPVILEKVITEGTTYTISCDQGMNQTLKAKDCEFYGWTSFAATLGNATFSNCKFGEGSGYAYCRPYAPTTFVGCDFEAGFEMDTRAAVTFENCTIGGVALTADNLSTLVTSNIANATVK